MKFKPVFEMMELRLTLSDVTGGTTPPPIEGGFQIPEGYVILPRENVDMTGCDSDDAMDFSNQSVPDTIPLYCDGLNNPFDPYYSN